MRFVVFGSEGIIGSDLVSQLSGNHNVVAVDANIDECKIETDNTIKYIQANILDPGAVRAILEQGDVVVNLAGISRITDCNTDVVKSLEVNVVGAVVLLEASLNAKCDHFFQASSLYANGPWGGFYSCSKRAIEDYIACYSRVKKLNSTIVRYGSVFGGGTDSNSLMAKIILASKPNYLGAALNINPNLVRDYIPVDLVNNFIIKNAGNPELYSKTIEFEFGEKMDVKKLIEIMQRNEQRSLTRSLSFSQSAVEDFGQYTDSPSGLHSFTVETMKLESEGKNLQDYLLDLSDDLS